MRVVVVVGVVALLATACATSGSGGSAPPSTLPSPSSGPASASWEPASPSPSQAWTEPAPPSPGRAWTYATDPTSCPASHPQPLVVVAELAEELEHLDDIDACTDTHASETWLHNRSDVVWRTFAEGPSTLHRVWDPPEDALVLEVFRAADSSPSRTDLGVSLMGTGNSMEPGTAVRVTSPPATASWRMDPVATGVYQEGLTAAGLVRDQAYEHAPRLVTDPRRRAHLTCALAGFKAGYDVAELSGTDWDRVDPHQVAEGITSVHGLTQDVLGCRTAVTEADQADLERRAIRAPVVDALDASRVQRARGAAPFIERALRVVRPVLPRI